MMLNIHTQYTRKIRNVQLGLVLNMCLSLLCATLPGNLAYPNSFSQPLGIEKVFVGTDFRLQTQVIHPNIATSYKRSKT